MLAGVTGSKLGIRAGVVMPEARDVVGKSEEADISTRHPALIVRYSRGLADSERSSPTEAFGR
jgi:hypothetical protein